MQKHLLSQKEVKEVQNKIKDMYGVTITSEKIEIGKEKRRVFYFVDGVLSFFNDQLIPTLCFAQKYGLKIPWVVIDEGAVKAIARGADLYAPGVIESSTEIKPGSLLLVKTRLGQPVALMIVDEGAIEALKVKKGKIATALHWIGDEIWDMCKPKN
ncbi:DUF1947 domain-containing protein [Metallosphaera hakonensis JCM 8857 = DSM 7519]|uniref:DUF1947 domain-containing protein n=1 Tax=Metallosphaera hakonensis JCM 8857 = DSM 7519 TaxID=1293036 RepID=A0A2U9IX09_9CREN|nr:DUF1947 domain-containing protein [Metallosphaera hakonensis]AWS00585.1 DUF1947 domain-containing protein [Metallosphaera hakonensis JCM 8857 = DSM 7519]